MLLEFQTADDSIFLVDVSTMRWGRVDKRMPDPDSKIIEAGGLTLQSMAARGITYALDPRTQKSEPGNGLCSISVMVVGFGAEIKIYLMGNVPLKEFTMPVPIRQVSYHIISEAATMEKPVANDDLIIEKPSAQNVLPFPVDAEISERVALTEFTEQAKEELSKAGDTLGLIKNNEFIQAELVEKGLQLDESALESMRKIGFNPTQEQAN